MRNAIYTPSHRWIDGIDVATGRKVTITVSVDKQYVCELGRRTLDGVVSCTVAGVRFVAYDDEISRIITPSECKRGTCGHKPMTDGWFDHLTRGLPERRIGFATKVKVSAR